MGPESRPTIRMRGLEFEAIAYDHQLVRLKNIRLVQHLALNVLADRRADRAVDVEVTVGKMQMLASMEGGKISGAREAAGPITNPAGRPGMGVNDVDLFPADQADEREDIRDPAPETSFIDRDRSELGRNFVSELPRGDESAVARLNLRTDERGGGSFGPRNKIAAQNVKDVQFEPYQSNMCGFYYI